MCGNTRTAVSTDGSAWPDTCSRWEAAQGSAGVMRQLTSRCEAQWVPQCGWRRMEGRTAQVAAWPLAHCTLTVTLHLAPLITPHNSASPGGEICSLADEGGPPR